MRSAMRTVEKRCEISTDIFPSVNSAKRSKTSCSDRASSASVGSSRISNCASRKEARARTISSYQGNPFAGLQAEIDVFQYELGPSGIAEGNIFELESLADRPGAWQAVRL